MILKKNLEEMKATRTPEQQARIDLHYANEKRWNKTAFETSGVWKTLGYKPKGRQRFNGPKDKHSEQEVIVLKQEEKPITVRLSIRDEHQDNERVVIEFLGDMVTDTSYTLDNHFFDHFKDFRAEEQKWALCMGTPNRYPNISIDIAVIAQYLEDKIPNALHANDPSLIKDEVFGVSLAPRM